MTIRKIIDKSSHEFCVYRRCLILFMCVHVYKHIHACICFLSICGYFLKKIFNVYFWERERERVKASMSWRGAEREGDREFEAGFTLSEQSLTWGLNPCTMRLCPKPKSMLNLLSHPGAPIHAYFYLYLCNSIYINIFIYYINIYR